MSRLTQSPFHAPSFRFPNAPLSPPETTVESVAPSVIPSRSFEEDLESERMRAPPQELETPAARFRRVSSLAYRAPGSPDRPQARLQNKAFIVVIPPQSLLHEPGLLSGPQQRLSQGVLMPLLPTMYGQLSAISKEFNFPSTVGVGLYYHYNDNGVTTTPRIADDTWPMFWSMALDGSAPTKVPNIQGKVEFDIDTQRAQWFSSWVARCQRTMQVDASAFAPFADTQEHRRNVSMSTAYHSAEETSDLHQSVAASSGRRIRHVPRQLSLVDRVTSSRQVPRPLQLQVHALPHQTLSPIQQAEEPVSAALQSKVQSWRASATLKPTGLTMLNGQTSLEPANLPNFINLDLDSDQSSPNGDDEEIKLEDYQWSVTSRGPPDYDLETIASAARLSSVDLAGRVAGSVLPSPSVCTSFGPSDYTLSPISIGQGSRIFTPDIAWRMYEDVPLTPSTPSVATSWGPASVDIDWENGSVDSRPLSLDLGERAVFSRPVTPETATSWGPPSWPASPVEISRPASVGIEYRMEFSPPETPAYRGKEFWSYALAESDVDEMSSEDMPVWPYLEGEADVRESAVTVHPDLDICEHSDTLLASEATLAATSVRVTAAYPKFELYPAVYPFNVYNIYAAQHDVITTSRPQTLIPVTVSLQYLPKLYPSTQYPDFEIYPYRRQDAYRKLIREPEAEQMPIAREYLPQLYVSTQYPDFDLYPLCISVEVRHGKKAMPPKRASVPSDQTVTVRLDRKYPLIEIYPALYPVIEIYPATIVYKIHRASKTHASAIASGRGRKIGRKSHYELHHEVLTRARKLRELHGSMFPDSTTTRDHVVLPPPPTMRLTTSPERERSITRRPSTTKLSQGLPPDPSFYRRSMVAAEGSIEQSKSSSPSLHRSASSASSNVLRRTPGIGSIDERGSLARSNSSPASQDDARRIMARRRDSVVLQRVKAYSNNLSSASSSTLLSRFPSPPRNLPPVASLPQPRSF